MGKAFLEPVVMKAQCRAVVGNGRKGIAPEGRFGKEGDRAPKAGLGRQERIAGAEDKDQRQARDPMGEGTLQETYTSGQLAVLLKTLNQQRHEG